MILRISYFLLPEAHSNLSKRKLFFYLLAVGVEREEGVFVHGGGEVRDLWLRRSQ